MPLVFKVMVHVKQKESTIAKKWTKKQQNPAEGSFWRISLK